MPSVWFILDDIEHVFAVCLYEFSGKVRADPPDESATEVFLDSFEGVRWCRLEQLGLELKAVVAVIGPSAAGLNVLTRLDQWSLAHYRDKFSVPADLHL